MPEGARGTDREKENKAEVGMKIITIRYECGCKARVIKPESTDGQNHSIDTYMLWCIKHTFEVGEAIEEYKKTEELI